MVTVQHQTAKRLLKVIASAQRNGDTLTYTKAAKKVGRDPKKNARMIGGVCDLLDAAAAYAGIPLLALKIVRHESGDVNRAAFTGKSPLSKHRDAILNRSKRHQFTDSDFSAISRALEKLSDKGLSRVTAWRHVYNETDRSWLLSRIAGMGRKLQQIDPEHATNPPAMNDGYVPSRAVGSMFGKRTAMYEDGPCNLYLMRWTGPSQHVLGSSFGEVSLLSVIKVGYSNSPRDRCRGLNASLPPASQIRWSLEMQSRLFANVEQAKRAEKALKDRFARKFLSLGNEYYLGELKALREDFLGFTKRCEISARGGVMKGARASDKV